MTPVQRIRFPIYRGGVEAAQDGIVTGNVVSVRRQTSEILYC
ncbi:MAG: hypothetical protein QOK19_78 [Solirubrobacteraceae bacterium]|jgi:hypothetical protein|nr:hypothetical protein [Solirubrobacteraceae bacterium]